MHDTEMRVASTSSAKPGCSSEAALRDAARRRGRVETAGTARVFAAGEAELGPEKWRSSGAIIFAGCSSDVTACGENGAFLAALARVL